MNDATHYRLILFQSVHHAIRAEKLLNDGECPCKMVPIPRTISSDCGVCVRIPSDLVTKARGILAVMQEPWRIEPLD